MPVVFSWKIFLFYGFSFSSHIKGWNLARSMFKSRDEHWALFAKSVLDRTRLSLASKGEAYHQLLQPSAEYLGTLLGVDQGAVCKNWNLCSPFGVFHHYNS